MGNGPLSVLHAIEHRRAKLAYQQAEAVGEDDLKEFKGAAERLPAMILTNGLLQALAFYRTKANLAPVCEAVQAWFRQLRKVDGGQSWDLIEHLLERSQAEYRGDTYEALAFAAWLKRFAEARHKEVKRREEATRQASRGGDEPGALQDTEGRHE